MKNNSTFTHEIKAYPAFFSEILSGKKTFEIRFDDRGYQVGHHLHIKEFDPVEAKQIRAGNFRDTQGYTGREVKAEITYVTSWAQKEGYIVMAIQLLQFEQSKP